MRLPILLTALAATGGAQGAPAQRPNIVFILADDLGYGDLACYGQPYIRTPHIDRLAREGMLFTDAYAGSPVSAPSRACLMTGQHTGHTAVRGNREYWRDAPRVRYGEVEEYAVTGQMPYDTAHVILPEMMRQAGYTTAIFGKWAGGYEGSVSTPDKRGVDEFYGYICQFQAHSYYPNFLNRYSRSRGDTAVVREVLTENVRHAMGGSDYLLRPQYSADLIHRRAMEWLGGRQAGQPFFALLTYTLPHAELMQPDDSLLTGYKRQFFWDRTWGGQEPSRYHASEHVHAQFAAMITRLDAYVGEVMALLERQGLADNTILIFSSDNGPHEEGGADPEYFGRDGRLRGLKRQCYEGGIRVPLIIRWPGHVRAGGRSAHPLAFYDMMPTLADLTGQRGYERRWRNPRLESDHFDGISFAPTLLGSGKQREHDALYWEFEETDQIGVRMGPWKLVVAAGQPRLYNLETDLHEDHDVAADHPDIVARMTAVIRREHEESPLFRVTLPRE